MSEQQYYDQSVRRQIHLESLKTHERNKFIAVLKKLNEQIGYHLINDELVEMSQADFNKVLRALKGDIVATLDEHSEVIQADLVEIATDSYAYEAKSLNNAFEWSLATVITGYIANRILKNPMATKGSEGTLPADLLKVFSEQEARRITNTVRQARHKGKNNNEIKQQIRGTKKSRYQDGVLSKTARNAETITRTLVQHVAQQAMMEVARRNSDKLTHIKIVATLDTRTSSICRALDNQVFRVEEGICPPLHYNCRSRGIFITAEEAKKVPTGKRASMHGMVDDKPYYEWLKDQPIEFQDDVLGKKRAQLFREGGLTPEQFRRLQLDKNFKPLTLEQIREREPMAFARIDKYYIPKRVETRLLTGARFTQSQLKKKFKHADVFGIDTIKSNPQNWQKFQQSIIKHLDDEDTREHGNYGFVANSKVYYNDKTRIAVAFDEDGKYITNFKLEEGTKQLENYLKSGYLR